MEGDAVELGERLRVGVVADDQRNLAMKFAVLVAVQQVEQAVLLAGNEDGHGGGRAGVLQTPAHPKFRGDGAELSLEPGRLQAETVERPLDPHEEKLQLVVLVLIGV